MQLSASFFVLASSVLSALAQSRPPQALNGTITELINETDAWRTTIDQFEPLTALLVGPQIILGCTKIINTLTTNPQSTTPKYSEADSQALAANLQNDGRATYRALNELKKKYSVAAQTGFALPIRQCLNQMKRPYSDFFGTVSQSLAGDAEITAWNVQVNMAVAIDQAVLTYDP